MYNQNTFLERLKRKTQNKQPVIGAGIGSGLSAEACEMGGADFAALYHTAIYRISGLPTMLSFLPYDNCNQMVFDTLPSVRCNLKQIPLFVGLGAHDPRCPVEDLVERAIDSGVDGIVNEPFCGIYGAMIRQVLDACDLGFQAEYRLITYALSKNLLTLGWSYSLKEAVAFAAAGSPLIGIIIDQNSLSSDTEPTLDRITEYLHIICDSVKNENPDSITLLHGKPLDNISVIRTVLKESDANGYFTGSAGERYPIIHGIKNAIEQLTATNETT